MREVKRSALIAESPDRMYELINDIERYPEFVPWCTASRVESRKEGEVVATLTIKRGPLRAEFTTRNLLEPGKRVLMQFVSGPFRVLEGLWTLTPLGDLGCRVGSRCASSSPIVSPARCSRRCSRIRRRRWWTLLSSAPVKPRLTR